MPRFLYYMARFLASQIAQDAQGIGVKGVTQKYVSEMKIPLPPLEEQEKIIGQIEQYQKIITEAKYSLQGTTQGRYLTGGVPPIRFSM